MSKARDDMNNTVNTLDTRPLIYVHGSVCTHSAEHLRTIEYTFFSSAHRAFTRIDHVLSQKADLRFQSIENVEPQFSKFLLLKNLDS